MTSKGFPDPDPFCILLQQCWRHKQGEGGKIRYSKGVVDSSDTLIRYSKGDQILQGKCRLLRYSKGVVESLSLNAMEAGSERKQARLFTTSRIIAETEITQLSCSCLDQGNTWVVRADVQDWKRMHDINIVC